jgi:hypothetical protein
MENLTKLYYKFDVLSISYAEFILYIAGNGIALNADTSLDGTTNIRLSINVEPELALLLKLKFGYFQINTKSENEIQREFNEKLAYLSSLKFNWNDWAEFK